MLPPAALLALTSSAVVLADARPVAWLARAFDAFVLADGRPTAFLVMTSYSVVLEDAHPDAWLAPAPLVVQNSPEIATSAPLRHNNDRQLAVNFLIDT
jgi:hypothetical protein